MTIMAVIVLALDLYLPESQRRSIALVTGVESARHRSRVFPALGSDAPSGERRELFWGGTIVDTLAEIFKIMVLIAAAIHTALLTVDVDGLA
ncbi:MAG: hypothetical protein U0703_11115 [Anaerolineae bacterium]